MIWILLLIAVLSGQSRPLPPLPEREPLAQGTSALSGRVFDSISRRPVPGAQVTAQSGAQARSVRTDRNGMWAIAQIAAGTYIVHARHETHLTSCFGATDDLWPTCGEVVVAPGHERAAVDIAMTPAATIRGRVFDPDGRPLRGVMVRPVAAVPEQKLLSGRTSSTDADGRFEITGMAYGTIVVRAEPLVRQFENRAGRSAMVRHPPAFFPGVLLREEAWTIDVAPGEVIELDIHIPPTLVGSIKTTVTQPDGAQLEQLRVMRIGVNEIRNVAVSDEGVGFADSLREGRYAVAARGRLGDRRLAAWQIVDLFSGELDVPLPLEPAARISGRVAAEHGGALPDTLRVVAAWTEHGVDLDPVVSDQADVGADGSFSLDGLFGTRTFRLLGLPAEWEIASVRAGQSDVTTAGISLQPGSTTAITITVARR